MSKLETNTIDTISGSTNLTLGGTNATDITIPSGVTITNNGTQSGFGGTNTPSFYTSMSANQSYSSSGSIVKVQFDTELWDTDSDYDNSTNYRFTPSVAGKYFVHGCVYVATFVTDSIAGQSVYIKKNGSNYQGVTGPIAYNSNEFNAVGTPFGIAVDMNGSTDYIECYTQVTFSSGTCNIQYESNGTPSFFGAYKLIGV